jgi:hypothetical protein
VAVLPLREVHLAAAFVSFGRAVGAETMNGADGVRVEAAPADRLLPALRAHGRRE